MSSIIVLDSSDEDEFQTKKVKSLSRTAGPPAKKKRSSVSTKPPPERKPPMKPMSPVIQMQSKPFQFNHTKLQLPLTQQQQTAVQKQQPAKRKTPPLTIPQIKSVTTIAGNNCRFSSAPLNESTGCLKSITTSGKNSPNSLQKSAALINNNIKIHLPSKRPVSSVADVATASSLPVTTVPKSDSNTTKRLKPTTLLKNIDEAWLNRERPVISLDDDEVVVPLVSFRSMSPSSRIPNIPKSSMSGRTSPKMFLDLTVSPQKKENRTSSKDNFSPISKSPVPDASAAQIPTKDPNYKTENGEADSSLEEKKLEDEQKAPLEADFEELLKACRAADSTQDMEKLIQTKLIKYYYSVHPDFVKSRGFRKTVRSVTELIKSDPDLVYYNVKAVVEELKVRRKSKAIVMNNEECTTTGNKKQDEQIKKLNKALFILTRRINRLDEDEVDLNDENSSYMQVERFKKRACEIYEKICDLTGESKNAHRLVKRPIQFQGSSYPQFNKTLQAYVNRTREFPDFFDVLRMLEHCNRQYSFGLRQEEIKSIAQDAFIKIGKLLQSRRKTDLYETVSHFTSNYKDPAAADPVLMSKLSENQKHQTKISAIIDKYARAQDLGTFEDKEDNCVAPDITQVSGKHADENRGDNDDEEDDDDEDDDEGETDKIRNGDLDADADDCDLSSPCSSSYEEAICEKIPDKSETTNQTNKTNSVKTVNNNNIGNLATVTSSCLDSDDVPSTSPKIQNGLTSPSIKENSAVSVTSPFVATSPVNIIGGSATSVTVIGGNVIGGSATPVTVIGASANPVTVIGGAATPVLISATSPTPIREDKVAAEVQTTNSPKGLKIVSVASLNDSAATLKPSSSVQTTPTGNKKSDPSKHRTLAEIVISDEES